MRQVATPIARPTVRMALSAVVGLALAACGGNGQADATGAGTSATSPGTATAPPSYPATAGEEQMRIRITIDGQRLPATIFDSTAGRDLLTQLPLTVEMTDHGGVEKTGPLPAPLSPAGRPDGADPDVGDVGYYAPGNDLVLYYGDQSYHSGIVILGRLDGDAASRIAGMDGTVTATVERHAG